MMASHIEIADGWGRLLFTVMGGDPRKIPDVRKYANRISRPKVIQEEAEEKPLTGDRKAISRWFAAHG